MLSAEPGDQTEAVRVAELQLLAFDMGCASSLTAPRAWTPYQGRFGRAHAFLAHGPV